jgi:hypothetical protein
VGEVLPRRRGPGRGRRRLRGQDRVRPTPAHRLLLLPHPSPSGSRPGARQRARGPRAHGRRAVAGRGDDDMSQRKVASMAEAVGELVRDGDTLAIEGVHPPDLVRGRARGDPPAQAGPDPVPAHPRRGLRPDDRGRGGVQAGVLVDGEPGGGVAARHPAAGRAPRPGPLELEEYSHFGMVGRYAAGRPTCRSGRCGRTSRPTCPGSTPTSARWPRRSGASRCTRCRR